MLTQSGLAVQGLPMDMEIIEPGEDESGNKLVQATARLPGKNKTFVHWRSINEDQARNSPTHETISSSLHSSVHAT